MHPASGSNSSTVCAKPVSESASQGVHRLIQKLRWARLEHEAQQLEAVMSRIPPELRGTVSAGPFSTD
jgi:hypothetical protein